METFSLTECGESEDSGRIATTAPFDFAKGDVFLLEKKKGEQSQVAEYRVFSAKIGLGKSPTKELQSALDAAPAGYKPTKVLFSKTGLVNFAVSILLERSGSDETRTEFRFIKEVTGFEKELGKLASEGFEFVYGRRIGMTKFALLARSGADKFSYSFVDREKLARDFDKTVAAGYRYHGLMFGDVDCGSGKTVSEKIVFEQRSSPELRQHRLVAFPTVNPPASNGAGGDGFQKLLASGFVLKDLVVSDGVRAVMVSQP